MLRVSQGPLRRAKATQRATDPNDVSARHGRDMSALRTWAHGPHRDIVKTRSRGQRHTCDLVRRSRAGFLHFPGANRLDAFFFPSGEPPASGDFVRPENPN